MIDTATIVALLGALGAGSVIGQWFAASKDRKTARAAVLKELAAVEEARWASGNPEKDATQFQAAIRQLETAALIGRVPRIAVLPYVQLAAAALWTTQERVEERGFDPEAAYLDAAMAVLVLDAAEIVSMAAWTSPWTRWIWLRRRLRRSARNAAAISTTREKSKIESARRLVR